ncbi:MAG TPA: AsmA family protein [Steroidobacteraceae bacterium]|nr:AsmA family protein [Steroidobacteraceae bacterium]
MPESGGGAPDGPSRGPRGAARWVLGIAAALVLLVVLVVGAALIATRVINPDHYKGEIESAVRHATGRPLVLEGRLRLTWFPWLGVRTGAARLGSPPGSGGPDLLDWQSARIRVRLLPLLLHRQLEIGRIRIVGADIHLRRAADGRGSWDDLLARLKPATNTTPHPSGNTRGPAAPSPTLAGLDLEGSSLDYVDERSREHINLTGWQLSVGAWSAGEPFSLSTRFLVHADPLGARAATLTAGTPTAGAAGVRTGNDVGGLRLPAAGVAVSLAVPQLKVQAAPLEAAAPRWTLQVGEAKLQGAAAVSRNAAGALTASGALTAIVPSLRQLASTLGVGMPVLADPAAPGPLSLTGNWSYQGGALEVRPLTVKLDSTTLTGWLAWSGAWTFALRADQIDFGRYLTRSQQHEPLELHASALRALHARGTIVLDRARIDGTTLEDARLQVQ